uniref:Endo/exonuclease/phosphatase domain-containing protein n=1 Tax=Haemonchus contortus TaxID=6289 RepID=A0A7I4YYY2_HAECO
MPRRDFKLITGDFNATLSKMRCVLGIHSFSTNGSIRELGVRLMRKQGTRLTKFALSKKCRASLRDVRVFRGADVGSGNHLVRASIELKLKRQEKKVIVTGPFAVEKLKDSDFTASFSLELRNRFAVWRKWVLWKRGGHPSNKPSRIVFREWSVEDAESEKSNGFRKAPGRR